mmetsp:Transcript_16323/g.39818  ORF Transcript_16323/g.39818 Transcript_16323/m.39818 type:complete len:214 (+) Transcript_16323:582-1223(+)
MGLAANSALTSVLSEASTLLQHVSVSPTALSLSLISASRTAPFFACSAVLGSWYAGSPSTAPSSSVASTAACSILTVFGPHSSRRKSKKSACSFPTRAPQPARPAATSTGMSLLRHSSSSRACMTSFPILLGHPLFCTVALTTGTQPCGVMGTPPLSGSLGLCRRCMNMSHLRGTTSSTIVKTPTVRPCSPCACTISMATDVLGASSAVTVAR